MGWGAFLKKVKVRAWWFLSLTLENVYLSRVHKSAIDGRIEECQDMLDYCADKLMVLAGASLGATKGDGDAVWDASSERCTELRELIAEMQEEAETLALLRMASRNRENLEDY